MSRTMRVVERAAAELGDDTLNDAFGERRSICHNSA